MKLATLLYIRNSKGEYLLLERANQPNKGLLSPPGGKLHLNDAESPFRCAVREASEECGITSKTSDWKLLGIITEKNYPHIGNIMLFLFEYKKLLNKLPPDFNEGRFRFVPENEILQSEIPETDKLYIWKFVLNKDNGFFSVSIDCDKTPYLSTEETD
ncbi:MAG: NUDIX hydrolase [Ignavibacteria bacterium]|nr:NUDIX hydrolase [Ignavibacteria bacterium]